MDKLPIQAYKRRYHGVQMLTKSAEDTPIPKEIKPTETRATSLPNCKRVRFYDYHDTDSTFDVLMDEFVANTRLPGLLPYVQVSTDVHKEAPQRPSRKFTLIRLQKIQK